MNKKKIIIPIVILALLAGAFFGAKKFRTANTTVEVHAVSTLNWGYMEDAMSIDGYVYDQDSQTIYPDVTQIISDVFVKEGQEVKKGDKLMAYDMASQELTLQIRKVAVEKARNNLNLAQAELNALYNTTPVPDYVAPTYPDYPDDPVLPDEPEEEKQKKPEHEKTKDAWNYLDETNIDDYYLSPIITIINSSNADSPDANSESITRNNPDEEYEDVTGELDNREDNQSAGSGNQQGSDNQGSQGSADSGNGGSGGNDGSGNNISGADNVDGGNAGDNGSNSDNGSGGNDNNDNEGSTGDNDGSDSENEDGTGGASEIEDIHTEPPEDGSINNPYRYIVTEDGVMYGSFLNELRKKENKYAVIEIRDENKRDGDLLASVTLNTNKIKEQDPEAYWYVVLRADGEDPFATLIALANQKESSEYSGSESYYNDYGSDYFNTNQPIQYTVSELTSAIKDKRREIKNLDLDLRRTELDLKMLQEQMEDGVITAKRDGVVTIVHDKENPPQDGSPFLKVDAGSGVVVQGSISELLLEKISEGQEISATDWESGGMYMGEIVSVDDYPADQSYYYGGNPNSSYYSFLAYFDEAQDLESGHWLQMSLDANANKENAIYLPNAYIRTDGQGKYVMKDEEGILTKQYIKCGKSYYGYVTEIKEGISNEDYVAFPYGDGAEAGAKTQIASEEEVMW